MSNWAVDFYAESTGARNLNEKRGMNKKRQSIPTEC